MSENIYNLKIFQWIQREVIESIINNCPQKSYEANEIIILQWNKSNWEWYIIKSWSVNISINWNVIKILNEWDIFWEIALLNDENRSATVTAKWNLDVIILNIDDLINMINSEWYLINKKIMKRIEENLERSN